MDTRALTLVTLRPKPAADPSWRPLERDLRAAVEGEVRFDSAGRALYATDASNYRHPPIGVVVPRHADDLRRTMEVCHRHGVPVLMRGGGTSLAGQCCNHAVVIDTSKHLTGVEIDPRARTARVQCGTVLDNLREAASLHGLTFGPDPSTHNRCTLGGMIGNNACGVHAVQSEFYGPGARTEDNVLSLDILTHDGVEMRVGPTSDEEYAAIVAAGGRKAEIYRRLRDLARRYAPLIRTKFPNIQRRVSGYNLPALLPENGFDLAKALVGSESTCVMVIEAEVQLIEDFPETALLICAYDSVFEAGDHVVEIRKTKPIGLEGFDRRLVDYLERKQGDVDAIGELPAGDGWLMVQFGGKTAEEAMDRAQAARAAIEAMGAAPRMKILTGEAEEEIWSIRKSGLGVTAFVPGEGSTWPGWEDSAVPPEKVGLYLRDLRKLADAHGYDASLYGHFGQGCIHCRFTFDLESEEGVARYRRFTDEAADLCLAYGGSLSGEHGDGQARGELLEKMFGPELIEAFREFKAIWDPDHLMNPGKIIDADSRTAHLRLGADDDRADPETYFGYPEDDGSFAHAALRCVGVGECRREDGGVMCPSYMVTRDEIHTTRGRAHMLFEMTKGDVVTDGWKSEEVKESLDLCLACKGCKSDCPVNVDMATYKAEFLSHYYRGRVRPRPAYAFGLIMIWARIASKLPRLSNFVSQTPGLSHLFKWAAGMAPERDVPRFATQTFRAWWRRREGARSLVGPRVMLWPDTFNDHFFPQTLIAAVELLEDAGSTVVVPTARLCCGRPLYDYGMLDRAKKLWSDILDELSEEIDAGTPIVGIEPSCVAAFRDELPGLMSRDPRAETLSKQVVTLAEYLVDIDYEPPPMEGLAVFHGHCHQHAVMGFEAEKKLLGKSGLDVSWLDAGCCGMAGSFGFEADKYDVSVAAGERKLMPAVRGASHDTFICADGFSCREQITQLSDRSPLHLAEMLRLGLRNSRLPQSQPPSDRRIARRSSIIQVFVALAAMVIAVVALACAAL